LQASYSEFEALHVPILAISSEDQSGHLAFLKTLPYDVLHDPGAGISQSYGAAYSSMQTKPASFILSERGVVLWSLIGVRASPQQLLDALQG